ncbi:Fibrobacter succinogenes major paralogous domain [Flavobacteriaceae bacterium]
MKKLFTLLALIATIANFAQAPQGFNYQATVRNSSGALITNQNVYFKFNVMLNSQTSVPVFTETHYVPTDDVGQVNLIIGQGTATTGVFSSINWGTGNYFLGIELDINTGLGYVAMGTTQLLSVPYALYANSSGNGQAVTPSLASVLAVNNGANNLQVKNLADPTEGQDAVTKIYTDTSDAQLQNQISTLQAQIIALQNAIVATLPNVTIGTQIWSTTNLDVTTYNDGTPIPQVTDPTAWAGLRTGAWCYYANNTANGTTFGKLYNWHAVRGIHDNDLNTPNKILAPLGWHVPSNSEWNTLINYLDPNANGGIATPNLAGDKMKSTGTTLWTSPNTGATNSSGFTGFPGGLRSYDGTFLSIGNVGGWWCSDDAWTRDINYNTGSAYLNTYGQEVGFSVRCVKN